MAVPGDRDVRAIARRLRAATLAQRICFGWDVEIRSGAHEGTFAGSPLPAGCAYVRLATAPAAPPGARPAPVQRTDSERRAETMGVNGGWVGEARELPAPRLSTRAVD